MNDMEAIQARHSVRGYLDKPLETEKAQALFEAIERENATGNLHMQLLVDEPKAFSSGIMKYGWFENVSNYIACVGPDDETLDERCGYHGEKIVLLAQELGLNTCWVGLMYSKKACAAEVRPKERLALVISLGYGADQGKARKSKPMGALCSVDPSYGEIPGWFEMGMLASQLAPTAMNQQKFRFDLLPGDVVRASTAKGPYANVDLGIARCHFEIGANSVSSGWNWERR